MKRTLYPIFYCLSFIIIFTPFAFAQGSKLSSDSLAPKTTVNWARDNYVAPKEEQNSPTTDQTDIDPNGPWMICEIKVDGLKNIRKKTITKNISAKIGHLYEKSSIQDDNASGLGGFIPTSHGKWRKQKHGYYQKENVHGR